MKRIPKLFKVVSFVGLASSTLIYFSSTNVKAEDNFYVEKVQDLPSDFIKGADISTLIAQEDSGVRYYDESGVEKDLITVLSENGLNYVRIRIWNNPYDENGNGYGAGNNDLEKAIEIGQRATNAGMRVLIDFHYSDFWADPGRQVTPKAWIGMEIDEKSKALYDFTKESLETLQSAGVDVGMVQIGNETTSSGIAGEVGDERYQLFKAGSQAVRDIDSSILIALHFTNPEKTSTMLYYADMLDRYKIDYDVFATSYYSFWHGSLDNLTSILTQIKQTYGKDTLVAETSYAYTLEDGDGQTNVIKSEQQTKLGGYPATVQGQADNLRDVIAASNAAGSLGVFYWEPAWTPVGNSDRNTNLPIWEKYGSGWASSFSISYDPNVNETNYGGSEWDNQALFDFSGKSLDSLKVFNLVDTGYGTVPIKEKTDEVDSNEEMINLLQNGSFEEEDLSMYTISREYVERQNDTPKSGQYALHFWSDTPIDYQVEQTLALEPGEYRFSLQMQGDQTGNSERIFAYVKNSDSVTEGNGIHLDGYAIWQDSVVEFTLTNPSQVTLGLSVTADPGAWGTTDDWQLVRLDSAQDDIENISVSESNTDKTAEVIEQSTTDLNDLKAETGRVTEEMESEKEISHLPNQSSNANINSKEEDANQVKSSSDQAKDNDNRKKEVQMVSDTKKLPRTGESDSKVSVIAGVAIIVMALIAGLTLTIKQKK